MKTPPGKVPAAPWVAVAMVALLACDARAQSATGEVDITIGSSTDGTTASSVQARVFGATRADWRFYAEATWATAGGAAGSDAFASAYPYDGRVRPMEVFGERTLQRGRWLVGGRAGRYRTPFGIAGRSDHAYTGFLRAPLIRYGTNFALSNTFLETGVEMLAGLPALYVQASLGAPSDEGDARRRPGLDQVVRAQGYYGGLIVGASYLHTRPSDRRSFVKGEMRFRGIDARWMRGGVELRGEWIDGRPFDGVATRGGYLDLFVHRPSMGPVTAAVRVERLDYDAGRFSEYLRRVTAGARVRVTSWLVAQVNVLRQPAGEPGAGRYAFDAAMTITRRF